MNPRSATSPSKQPIDHADASSDLKGRVCEFWQHASCGEVYATGESDRQQLESHARARYALEPYLPVFARFAEGVGKDVLEIGVGMGADHAEWAKVKPKSLTGVDLTSRAVDFTQARLRLLQLSSLLKVADAEDLPFEDCSFDLVYSWGVLHHSPDTPRAVREVWRVLRPGGVARVMVYHTYSLTGYMLWLRYAFLAGRPFRSLAEIYAHHLESPGTKAYTPSQARTMFSQFRSMRVWTQLSFGDLLQGAVGQRHRGIVLASAKALWPRWLIKRWLGSHGLLLLIEATK